MATLQATEVPLAMAPAGPLLCLKLDVTGEDAVRLKRMGICEGRSLELVTSGDPMVIRVCGTQLGLSRRLAMSVLVGA